MSDELFDIGLQAVSLTADLPDPIITVSGANSYTVDNTADYHILGLSIHGKSTQDGTPTPENPVDIVSVGDGGAVEITACGKNLVDPSKITNGGFDYASGAEINNSGRARTGYIAVTPAYLVGSVPNGYSIISIYHYTATKEFLGVGGVSLLKGQNGFIRLLFKRTDGAKITDDDLNALKNNIIVTNGESIEYEPYKGSTASITTALPLCGIPVDSGGNYTDSNGQQWVCDELIYNADGTGKIIKRIEKYTFDGSADERWINAITKSEFTNDLRIQFAKINGTLAENINSSSTFLYCNRLQYNNTIWNTDVSGCQIASVGDFIVRMPSSVVGGTDVTAFKSWLASNPLIIVYQIVPQEIELSAAEMAELKQLQSFDSVTNIYNNSGADMTVKILRRDYDMQYVFWIEESQTWVCPIGGKWKIICVGGGASGGQQYGTGAVLYGAGGTTSFGSIISAEGGAAADKTSERIAYGQGGYDGVSYGWAPESSAIGTGVNSQAHGYGAGGSSTPLNLSVTGPSGSQITKVAGGLCGKIKSTIVDLAESQSVICTVGDGGVLNITDSELKSYLMAANSSITAVATTATEFNAAAGKGKKGLIIAQYLGY